MPTTTYGWITPSLSDENNPPADLASLAQQIEDTITGDVVRQYGPTRVSLINGWSGVSYYDPEVDRVGETVYLTGLADPPASPFTTVFQLPSWAYPRRNIRLTATSLNNKVGMVSITTSGSVSLLSTLWSGTPTGYINLTGTWRAA